MFEIPDRLRSSAVQILGDLRSDPVLRWVLVLAVLLFGFGIWFRVPNFAGPDEFSRLIQPMKIAGRFVSEPSFESLQRAATDGRALGATIYLHGLILLPLFVLVLVSGNLGQFVQLGGIESRWALWHAAPDWFWTGAVLLGRLLNLVLALCCVYLLYRLGVRLEDRWTGRVAAAGLTVTFGFAEAAHLVGEDIPMVICLLTTVLLSVRYVENGSSRVFYLSCLTAGATVAFKLTGGSAVLAVGASYLLRALVADDGRAALARPVQLSVGGAIGLAVICLGFPSVLLGGPSELVTRVLHTSGQKTTLPGGFRAGIGFWLLRGYLAGFGLPLAVGILAGVGVWVLTGWDRREFDPRTFVVLTPIMVTLAVFSTWNYVRVHHLLPTFPLLLIVGALGTRRLAGSYEQSARLALALLFVSGAVFTGVGDFMIATDPRDEATEWLVERTDSGDTVEVYENSVADVAAVHGQPTSHYGFQEENATYDSSLVLNETAYTEWMVDMPERRPEYIQLTGAALRYTEPAHPDFERFPRRRAYVTDLLNGEYNYSVVARFGSRQYRSSALERLLLAGLVPAPESREDVVIILARDPSGQDR